MRQGNLQGGIKRPRSQNTKFITFRNRFSLHKHLEHRFSLPDLSGIVPRYKGFHFSSNCLAVGKASDTSLADSNIEGYYTSSNGCTAPPKGKANLCKTSAKFCFRENKQYLFLGEILLGLGMKLHDHPWMVAG